MKSTYPTPISNLSWLRALYYPKKKKNQVLDRTKVLHGPRTQTYGETSYFQEKTKY